MPQQEFSYTGQWQTWRVPKRVEWVEVVVNGAGSGARAGGQVSGRINVKGQRSLKILVGEKGRAPAGETGGAPTFGGGGAGGNGRGASGGYSGGGATSIRQNSRTGALRAVAAGAGGTAGDGGLGGQGGADVGEAGTPAPVGTVETGNATGGTQIQGGFGGTSLAGDDYEGSSAPDTNLGRGGAGGTTLHAATVGGGGGGGGYRSGGGGHAGIVGIAAAGGGGGGSNYRAPLTGYTSSRATGGTGHGSVILSWVEPRPANQPPNAPTEVKIRGKDAADEFVTQSRGNVKISARVNNPENKQNVRLVVIYSATRDFATRHRIASEWVKPGKRAEVRLTGLARNTRWYARLYAKDARGLLSVNYTSINFWTNRDPHQPLLMTPSDDATISELDSVLFEWSHTDPDDPESPQQRAFELEYRRVASPVEQAGDWNMVAGETYDETWVAPPGLFAANATHEWRVRTMDQQRAWGPWSIPRSFFVSGETTPPNLVSPINDEAVDMTEGVEFTWVFRDPHLAREQVNADLRYRAMGSTEWVTLVGTPTTPGAEPLWLVEAAAFTPGLQYEWQVRTQASVESLRSQWSESQTFWPIRTPGSLGATPIFVETETIDGSLGCGRNEVYVYDRGGQIKRGQIKPLAALRYNRRRDDISNCVVVTNGFDSDCGSLLATIEPWMHELVVFRDGVRVWEGPVTRAEDTPTGFEIEAKDVTAYLYRRIMRQGYNDAYRVVNNTQIGQRSVVERALRIAMNALAPDDPNVLAYLTSIDYPDDARQSRSIPDFSKMAWEEIDDLAANAGLDYTAVGRRILLWDTHRPVGRLSELRDVHFDSPPVISKYGMLLATGFGVTNNAGIYGYASRDTRAYPENPYGLVEQLASAYGESEGAGSEETLTSEARENLERVLTTQAERNISNRYPTPRVVRIPDNSRLHPDTPIPFDYLVPGVWIPLRARGTVLELSQWQKLDAVVVEESSGDEKVQLTMSPAPNEGADPDAEGLEEE